MALASPFFLSMANFRAIAIGLAPTAIIAVGMTILLVSGGFDLSVGSVLALREHCRRPASTGGRRPSRSAVARRTCWSAR